MEELEFISSIFGRNAFLHSYLPFDILSKSHKHLCLYKNRSNSYLNKCKFAEPRAQGVLDPQEGVLDLFLCFPPYTQWTFGHPNCRCQ